MDDNHNGKPFYVPWKSIIDIPDSQIESRSGMERFIRKLFFSTFAKVIWASIAIVVVNYLFGALTVYAWPDARIEGVSQAVSYHLVGFLALSLVAMVLVLGWLIVVVIEN